MWIVCSSVTKDKRFKLAKIMGENLLYRGPLYNKYLRPKVLKNVQERNKSLSSLKFLDLTYLILIKYRQTFKDFFFIEFQGN